MQNKTMNPPELILGLQQGKQLSRFVMPEFLAKFSANSSFCLFPTSLHILIKLFNEVRAIIDAANDKTEQKY